MRIGIQFPGIAEELGGGFTVEDDVYRGLMLRVSRSRHKFIVFCKSEDKSRIVNTENIEVVAISWFHIRRLRSVIVSIFNNISWGLFRFPRLIENEGYLDSLLNHHRVDVFLNISQPSYIAEIPFIAVQWDLQHRVHSFFPEVSAGGRWYRWESRFSVLLRRAAIVITGSQTGRREIEYFYQIPTERVRVIPLPVPCYVLQLIVNDSKGIVIGLGVKRPYLLYPAQFWPHKNHINLLYALKIIRLNGCDLDLVLVGSEKGNVDYVKSVANELGLSDNIHFLGFVDRVKLIALYKEAFALSYLTFFGPDNIPPLEAFALGCPVVASGWIGAEEQLEGSALIADPTNPNSIAQEIQRLYDPHLRAELINKGRKRALLLSTAQYIDGLFSVLDDFEPYRRCWGQNSTYPKNYRMIDLIRKIFGG